MAACLLVYMMKSDAHVLSWMLKSLADISIHFKNLGSSLDFSVKKFAATEQEDEQRNFLGLSSRRKSIVISNICDEAKVAMRKNSDPAVADSILKSYPELKWNSETLQRYAGLGRRLKSCPATMDMLARAEHHFGRKAFLDGIAGMRALMGLMANNGSHHMCELGL